MQGPRQPFQARSSLRQAPPPQKPFRGLRRPRCAQDDPKMKDRKEKGPLLKLEELFVQQPGFSVTCATGAGGTVLAVANMLFWISNMEKDIKSTKEDMKNGFDKVEKGFKGVNEKMEKGFKDISGNMATNASVQQTVKIALLEAEVAALKQQQKK